MRIEVLVGSEDPVVYPLNSPKLSVGTSENCEIIVSADGVSRKHLTIFVEGDQYFVADQGSTNGSFINEERLVPGRKVEFTSFFPVRLGENVLISLLSDDEGSISIPFPTKPKKESTSSDIKVSSGKTGGTGTIKFGDGTSPDSLKTKLQKNEIRKRAAPSRPAPGERIKKKTNMLPIMAFLLVAGAAYYNFFVLEPSGNQELPSSEVGKVIPAKPVAPEAPKINPDIVPEADAPKKESYSALVNDIKCTTEGESYLCNLIPGANEKGYGVVQSGLTFNAFINGDKYVNEARQYLKNPQMNNPESVREYMDMLYTTAIYIFLYKYMPALDEAKLGADSRVAIGFFKPTGDGKEIEKIVVFYPKIFNREKEKFNDAPLMFAKRAGSSAFDDFRKNFLIF